MRLVIDMQACQSPSSRVRGIGRFSLALSRAMVQRAGKHECVITLNSALPDSAESLRSAFTDLLPVDRICGWASTASIAEAFHGGAPRSTVAGELFRHAMREFQPDFLHIGSLFEGLDNDVANVVGVRCEGLPTVVTLHDLIPLKQREMFLDPHPHVRDWYMRRLEQLKRAELLLSNSAFSRSECVDLLDFDSERIINVRGACDARFRRLVLDADQRLALRRRYGIDRPYIMYAGALDPHKNIPNLIRAYAALPSELLADYQLLIVGSTTPAQCAQVKALCIEFGLMENQCVLGGYVPDEELVLLYNDCRLYAFPSLQEGFGLPALEAMSCGAVVVGSNVSSLPEVIGFADALFDPHDVSYITAALQRGLSDEDFRHAFLDHARTQVGQFSWEESARRAWDGLEAVHERHNSSVKTNGKMPVAFVATTPESRHLVKHLPGFVDMSRARIDELAKDDVSAFLVISDAASALTAWQVMRCRMVGVMVAGDGVIAKIVQELYAQPEGKAILDFILADEGAYTVALRKGDAFFAGLTQVVDAWMHRVAAQVVHGLEPQLDALTLHRCGRGKRTREAITRMLALPAIPVVNDSYWKDVAEALNHNRQVDNFNGSRLLVDVSYLAVQDSRTGIQRVVRNLLRYLLCAPPAGRQVLPIYFDRVARHYRYARCFSWRFLGVLDAVAEDEIVDWLPNDEFLGLDLAPDIVSVHQEKFARWRDLGVRLNFVLHDMLPERRPDCFSDNVVESIRQWYRAVGALADGIICNSRATAADFIDWLDQVKIERPRPIKVGYFHLGADPEVDHADELDESEKSMLDKLADRPTVLMVSTIEPRKGYQQALEAFELLWQQGQQINLVIVGKAGWRTEALVERLRTHAEAGQRLHWCEGISDALLHALYKRSHLLLSASEGEGFGLPIIEAAHYGISLLLRNLRVFREVAEDNAKYFDGYEPQDLAKALQSWHECRQQKQPWPDSRAIGWLTWQESYRQFLEVLEGKRWDHQVGVSPRFWFPSVDPRMQTQCGTYKRGKLYSGDAAGMLIYGPYAKVPDGTYRLRAYGELDRHDPDNWLDVASDSGRQILFKGDLAPGDADGQILLESVLTLSRPVKDLEIRVWSSGQSQLRLDGLELVRLSKPDQWQ